MEDELFARETAEIWENMEDLMEEEFEDCANTSAASTAVDPQQELEEARVRFQLKFNEKTRQLERIKRLLEETTTTLQNLKKLKSFDLEEEEWQIKCLEKEIEEVQFEKQRRKRDKDERQTSQLFKDSFFKDPFFNAPLQLRNIDDAFIRSLEKKAFDVKVPKDKVEAPKDGTETNKPESQQ